jgi:hypothetical protein
LTILSHVQVRNEEDKNIELPKFCSFFLKGDMRVARVTSGYDAGRDADESDPPPGSVNNPGPWEGRVSSTREVCCQDWQF